MINVVMLILSLIVVFVFFKLIKDQGSKIHFQKSKIIQLLTGASWVLVIFNIPLMFFVDYTLSILSIVHLVLLSFLVSVSVILFVQDFQNKRIREFYILSSIGLISLVFFVMNLFSERELLFDFFNSLLLIPVVLVLFYLFNEKTNLRISFNKKNYFFVVPLTVFLFAFSVFNLSLEFNPVTPVFFVSIFTAFFIHLFNLLILRDNAELIESKNMINSHLILLVLCFFVCFMFVSLGLFFGGILFVLILLSLFLIKLVKNKFLRYFFVLLFFVILFGFYFV